MHLFLRNLTSVAVGELSICWFRLYLTGRVQDTDVDGTMSVAKGITCDAPQGYIIWPLLFLLYMTCLLQLNASYCCTRMIPSCLTQEGT